MLQLEARWFDIVKELVIFLCDTYILNFSILIRNSKHELNEKIINTNVTSVHYTLPVIICQVPSNHAVVSIPKLKQADKKQSTN